MFSTLAKEYIAENKLCFGCSQDIENDIQCQKKQNSFIGKSRVDDKQEGNLWQSIIDEYEEKRARYTEWKKRKENSSIVVPYQDKPSNYLNKEIFPLLLPAMEKMLAEARRWDVLKVNYFYKFGYIE